MTDPLVNLFVGFVLGVVGSIVSSVAWDRLTAPTLTVSVDTGRAVGQSAGNPMHEFFHLVVTNRREPLMSDLLVSPRPAWSCSATLEVLPSRSGAGSVAPISARWTSMPEPIAILSAGGSPVQVPDIARMLAGRRVDIHPHVSQQLSTVLKFEGEDACYLFTNESYLFDRWSNPAWQLGLGRHHLRVAIHFERGTKLSDFWIENSGSSRDDLKIVAHNAV